jgi:hypothetical protein
MPVPVVPSYISHSLSRSFVISLFLSYGGIHDDFFFDFFLILIVFYSTFSNISAISWRPDLAVEEDGVPAENHRPWASNW